jgi:hypothetical protein
MTSPENPAICNVAVLLRRSFQELAKEDDQHLIKKAIRFAASMQKLLSFRPRQQFFAHSGHLPVA